MWKFIISSNTISLEVSINSSATRMSAQKLFEPNAFDSKLLPAQLFLLNHIIPELELHVVHFHASLSGLTRTSPVKIQRTQA